MVIRRVMQNTVRDRNIDFRFHRVFQGSAEFWSAGFGFFQDQGNESIQQQVGVVAVGGELVSGAFAVLFFIAVGEVGCQTFGWVAFWQQLWQDGQTGADERAFYVFAAQAYQITRGGAVGLVDFAYVCAFTKILCGKLQGPHGCCRLKKSQIISAPLGAIGDGPSRRARR